MLVRQLLCEVGDLGGYLRNFSNTVLAAFPVACSILRCGRGQLSGLQGLLHTVLCRFCCGKGEFTLGDFVFDLGYALFGGSFLLSQCGYPIDINGEILDPLFSGVHLGCELLDIVHRGFELSRRRPLTQRVVPAVFLIHAVKKCCVIGGLCSRISDICAAQDAAQGRYSRCLQAMRKLTLADKKRREQGTVKVLFKNLCEDSLCISTCVIVHFRSRNSQMRTPLFVKGLGHVQRIRADGGIHDDC